MLLSEVLHQYKGDAKYHVDIIPNLSIHTWPRAGKEFLVVFRSGISFYYTHKPWIKKIAFVIGNYRNDQDQQSTMPMVIIEKSHCGMLMNETSCNECSDVNIHFELIFNQTNLYDASPNQYKKASLDFDFMKNENATQKNKKNQKYMIACFDKKNSKQVVKTSKWFYELLDSIFNFDYDPCPLNAEKNAFYTEWGSRNFVNPPFSFTNAFCQRAVEQARDFDKRSVILSISRVQTRWFQWLYMSGYLKAVVFLRTSIVFEGYNRPLPHGLFLLIIEKSEQPPLFLFWDPDKKKKRRLGTRYESFPNYVEYLKWK